MVNVIASFSKEYDFLSNFYMKNFFYKGKEYASSEHVFQAEKAKKEEDHEYVRFQATAALAKKAGRRIDKREDWDTIKDGVMLDILRVKFSDPELQAKLFATGDAELIEGNWWNDTYWGVCRGEGKNVLGNLLMIVRSEIEV